MISELNYNPYPPTAAETAAGYTTAEDFEFIEIQNVGTNSPDLIATQLTNGVQFQFPQAVLTPGQRAVIVSNLAAFQARYGTSIPVLGQYTGSLDNIGERLTMVSAVGDVLVDFTYGDDSLWPQMADGRGASLQLINPAVDARRAVEQVLPLARQHRVRRLARQRGSSGTRHRHQRGAEQPWCQPG